MPVQRWRLVFVALGGATLLAALLVLMAPRGLTHAPYQDSTPQAFLPLVAHGAALVTAVPSTPTPANTVPPAPTATAPPSGWLAYINYYRAMAYLPVVTENTSWSDGCWLHGRYMVKNDYIGHSEDPGNLWYTAEGNAAAQNSNVMVSSNTATTDEQAIDLWMRGPFHAVGIIDPALLQAGFGSYREAVGQWQMGAALDVLRGLGTIPPSIQFPVQWPGSGTTANLRSYNGGEMPDPLASCPGYSIPSGLPILIQIGPGNLTPDVTAHSFLQGGTPLEHCIFDETSYSNPNAGDQSLGRAVLNARDAIVLIPRQTLTPGATYTVSITTNGQTYVWSFTVSSAASSGAGWPDMRMR